MKKFIIFILTLFAFSLVSCQKSRLGPDRHKHKHERGQKRGGQKSKGGSTASVCKGKNDLSHVPIAFLSAMKKYTSLNNEYLVFVCTEDINGDGNPEYIVVEATDLPEHKSVYYDSSHKHYEGFDYFTNVHKYSKVYEGYTGKGPRPAGRNKIEKQTLILKMPVPPSPASNKTETSFGAIGIALNGVAFFNENAAPGHQITDELFTFDQCSGHPQGKGMYHYHVDPICLIRDLGGSVKNEVKTSNGTTYKWIEDTGGNAGMLLGFLMDGFPVYGPIGIGEKDCRSNSVPAIDGYNGHQHCTTDFNDGIYHYHVKTGNLGGTSNPIFWITNKHFFGKPGSLGQ